MKVSRQGIIEIASHEAIVDMPYRDSNGIWTVGIGHTASAGPPDPSQMPRGRRVPMSEIFRMFTADLATFEKRVNKAVKVPVAQHEFDALTSFDFNTGGINRATLVRHLNDGDRAKAATAFMNWSKPPEIIDRRTKEMELFRSGHYSSSGKVTVYPADKNGHVLWRRGKTVDASKILDPSVFEGAPEAPLYSAPVILRIGSTGDTVALVQKKVGVEADGWFGPITRSSRKRLPTVQRPSARRNCGSANNKSYEASPSVSLPRSATRALWHGLENRMSAFGDAKRTALIHDLMSANDPKHT